MHLICCLLFFFSMTIGAPAQETRTVTDDLGRTLEVPAVPQRIVSTADLTISMALADFGIPFVGSEASIRPDGSLHIRHVDTVYGITLEGDDIAPIFVGEQFDFEAMLSIDPDLIIAVDAHAEFLDRLEVIAPVYFVAEVPTPFAVQHSIARALGLEAEFEKRRELYRTAVAALRESLDIPEGTTWSLLTPWQDRIRLANGNFNFTQVLDDLGLAPNPLTQEQIDGGVLWSEWYSVEALPRMDADFVFMHYSTGGGFPPTAMIERMEALLPNWCDFMTACATGNVILIPGASINAPTFDSLNATLDVVGSHLASRMVGGG